jgi:hypothetical protein
MPVAAGVVDSDADPASGAVELALHRLAAQRFVDERRGWPT